MDGLVRRLGQRFEMGAGDLQNIDFRQRERADPPQFERQVIQTLRVLFQYAGLDQRRKNAV